jgi:hypothetical protein
MTEPAPFDPNRTPFLTLGGKQWPVPPLVADQLDMIWDDVIALSNVLFAQSEEPPAEEGNAEAANLRRGLLVVGRRLELTAEQFKKLRSVVYYGLLRAHPALTLEAFRAIPATSFQMLNAFFVVRRQSGIYGDFEGLEEVEPSGEAKAA